MALKSLCLKQMQSKINFADLKWRIRSRGQDDGCRADVGAKTKQKKTGVLT
jgi:hypothetical protein